MIVPAVGPKDAKILLIGEAPGEEEMAEGKPFVGSAGKLLNSVLEEVGINRENCYITNIMQVRPPDNAFSYFYVKGEPTPELLDGYRRLHYEIASISPNVIVALGNEPMKALGLTGTITNYRGSVLSTPHGKVIPTFHPTAVLRNWSTRPSMVVDFKRALEQSGYPEVRRTHRELVIVQTLEEALHEIEGFSQAKEVSFDIETESEQVTCISFASSERRAVCFPIWFLHTNCWNEDEEATLWEALRGLLESESPKKIGQNGSYDMEFLKRNYGITTRGYFFDTMLGFHVLYPELPKGLDYMVSIYTDHPYYKYQRKSAKAEEHYTYNATDAVLTFECYQHIYRELDSDKLLLFYQQYVHNLVEPLSCMEYRGVAFDAEYCITLRRKYRRDLDRLERVLHKRVGYELNNQSNPQMLKWLYEDLKLPKLYKKRLNGTKTLTADEEALNTLYSKSKNKALRTILTMREKQKILSTYLQIKLDPDKRMRCNFNICGSKSDDKSSGVGTETGRLSSSKTLRGTGTNLQNIPPLIRQLFLADPGKIFINADLSQAEARVVAYLAGDVRLIKVFESGGDIHRRNAANIFNKGEQDVTTQEREMAKRVVHASNYGMGARTFSKTAGIDESQAKRLLNQYFANYPAIKLWHMRIGTTLRETRQLTTPFGRRRIFFNKWDESLIKEGLAFIPQSTVADLVNQALIDLHNDGVELLIQVHDSILAQCPVDKLEYTIQLIRTRMTRPLEINNRTMIIPVDVKVGYNWLEMSKVTI